MDGKTSTRTASVELLRFIAAVAIMLVHFTAVYGHRQTLALYAYVFVDFFLLLTGFFMMQYLQTREKASDPAPYILRKAAGVYPVFLFAFSMQFILFVYSNHVRGAYAWIKALFHFKWEVLLLHCAGFLKDPSFNVDYLLGQDWYLSAMLLGLLFVYPLALYWRRLFTAWLAPAATILIYALLIQNYGELNVGSEYLGVVSTAILRGVAGLCAGSVCYTAYARLRARTLTAAHRRALSAVEVLLWVLVALLLSPWRYSSDLDAPFYLLLFAVLVELAVRDEFGISHFLNHHGAAVWRALGELSLYTYLLHWTVMTAMNTVWPGAPMGLAMPVYFAVTLAGSAALLWVRRRRKSAAPVAAGVAVLLGVSLGVAMLG